MNNTSLDIKIYLNMQMIVDDLEDDYDISFFYANEDKKFSYPEIYYGQKDLKPNILYVAEASVYEKHPITTENISRVCVGAFDIQDNPDYSIIVLGDGVNWQEIYNRVQKTFNRYISWNQKLINILDSGGGLYELCVAGIEFFDNPLYVHDENFNILAMPKWVVGMNHYFLDENTGNLSVPMHVLARFKEDPEFLKTLSVKKAALWNPKRNSHRVLYVNIWAYNSQYCGRFLIQELNSSFKPSDFRMAEHFARILAVAFERNLFKTRSVSSFEEILKGMVMGEEYEEGYFRNRMKMVGWSKNDSFICFAMMVDKGYRNIISMNKVCSSIRMAIKESFSFAVDDMVYSICNLTLEENSIEGVRLNLERLSEGMGAFCGGSMEFTDIRSLPAYCRQAKGALRTCIEAGRARVLLFSDNVLEYIISHFKEEYDVDMVCSKAVRQLKNFDAENGTDYLETLRRYLENGMQQTLTANELYIHRSTLIYRIKKIQELTGVDLDDPDMRLYIQISIRLENAL